MPLTPLPRTSGCIVCGPDNPHGLHLTSHVDAATGRVVVPFSPGPTHIGFDGLIHGGVLSTVADEAMVWAAIWATRRSCVAGELSVRFRQPVAPGDRLVIWAAVVRTKGRLVETTATLGTQEAGIAVATATGKYLAGSPEQTTAFLHTFVDDPESSLAVDHLRNG